MPKPLKVTLRPRTAYLLARWSSSLLPFHQVRRGRGEKKEGESLRFPVLAGPRLIDV